MNRNRSDDLLRPAMGEVDLASCEPRQLLNPVRWEPRIVALAYLGAPRDETSEPGASDRRAA